MHRFLASTGCPHPGNPCVIGQCHTLLCTVITFCHRKTETGGRSGRVGTNELSKAMCTLRLETTQDATLNSDTDGGLGPIYRLPRKCFFRQRAHCNPLSDSYLKYPASPDHVDWRVHYPHMFGLQDTGKLFLNTTEFPIEYDERVDDQFNGKLCTNPRVEFVDIGCGYGGLSLALAKTYPSFLTLGMEIREKVTTYVGEKIRGLRQQHQETGLYSNVSVIRTNVMKFLVNYFRKAQLSKMFFCFPDPHFKRSNERRRIIGPALLSMYAYVLKPGGRIYTVTDVVELHEWMYLCLMQHPLFERCPITPEEDANDPCIHLVQHTTEEGNKARRMEKSFYSSVFYRV